MKEDVFKAIRNSESSRKKESQALAYATGTADMPRKQVKFYKKLIFRIVQSWESYYEGLLLQNDYRLYSIMLQNIDVEGGGSLQKN